MIDLVNYYVNSVIEGKLTGINVFNLCLNASVCSSFNFFRWLIPYAWYRRQRRHAQWASGHCCWWRGLKLGQALAHWFWWGHWCRQVLVCRRPDEGVAEFDWQSMKRFKCSCHVVTLTLGKRSHTSQAAACIARFSGACVDASSSAFSCLLFDAWIHGNTTPVLEQHSVAKANAKYLIALVTTCNTHGYLHGIVNYAG